MMRHEGLDANTFPNNAQRIPKREFRVNDVGGIDRRSDPQEQAVLLHAATTSCATTRHATQLHDRPDGARARRQLQPDVRPRRERPSGAGADLRSVQRRAARPGSLSAASRFPNAIIPNPDPCGAADVQLLPAAEPDAGRRVQHEQLRGDDRPDDPAPQLEQPRRLPHRPPLDLRQRRHLLRRDHHARARSARRRSTAPTASAATSNPVRPDRRRDRRRPDAGASTSATASAASTPRTCPATRRASTTTTRSACPANLQPLILFPGAAPNVNPNGLRRRQRRRQQLDAR